MTNTQEKKSAKNQKNSFSGVDIGTPQVPIRKSKPKKQERESLSDWEHAS
ncbi:hypothetical protein [Richelia sinica]|nr:hypothetical protein [Richelia sinica]MBD2663156.1 hypothetical protein [Richelia sinica FACHB-800]